MAPVSDDDSVQRKLPVRNLEQNQNQRPIRTVEYLGPALQMSQNKELVMLESRDPDTLEILSIKLQYLND